MSTDEQAARTAGGAAVPPARERPADPGRRQFFRAFGRQTVVGAGNVIGAADALRRGGATAANELLGLGFGSPQANAARLEERLRDDRAVSLAETVERFSSAYAYSDEALVLLDQRLMPAERRTVECREPSEVAAALRAGVIGGGPILAEISAHTLVLAAATAADRGPTARRQAFDTAADTLLAARPSVRAASWAVERMRLVHRRLAAETDAPPELVSGLRREAEAIAMELALDHAALGRHGAETLAGEAASEPLNLLLHGDMGPLSCGLVGTGFAVLRSLLDMGRQVHVWLTDGGPNLRGGELSALQLRQLDVPHTIIPDAALGWLFAHRPVSALLLRCDSISRAGDACCPIGAIGAAQQAAAAGVPVLGCATTASIQPAGARPPDLSTELAPPHAADGPSARLQPLADLVPAGLIDALVTEKGRLRPPFDLLLEQPD